MLISIINAGQWPPNFVFVEIHRKTTSNMTIVRYTILDIHPVNETHDEQTYCCCSKASASQILIYWEDFAQNCTVLGKSPTHFPIIAQVTVPPVIQYISIWLASYPKMPRFCKPKCSDHFKKILCKNFFCTSLLQSKSTITIQIMYRAHLMSDYLSAQLQKKK